MKKVSALIIVVLILVSLFSACSGESSTSKTTTTTLDTSDTTSTDTTIRMMWWGSQVRHDGTIAAIEMYMDKNPNINVEYEYSGWDGYWDKVATQAAANTLPNVWQQSTAYLSMYANAGQIIDLQPYVDKGLIDLSDWSPAAIDSGKLNDILYSLSMGMTAHTLVYDPAIFAKAGVEEPTPDWTWDKYFEKCKAIYDALGIPGDETFCTMNSKDGLRHYIFSQGYTFYNEDQTELAFPKEMMVEFLNWELKGQKEGWIADQATQNEITTLEQSLIVTGDAAMRGAMNSNQCVAIMEAAGRELVPINYPHSEGESRWGTVLGPSMIINMSNTGTDAEKDESAKLLNFILNDIDANLTMGGERGVPSSSRVVEALLSGDTLSPYAKLSFDYVNSVSPYLEPDPDVIKPPADGEIMDIYKRLRDQVMFGQITAEEAADALFKEGNSLLATSKAD
jgi:multiple sugar transport system substrate-binding protein